MNGSVPTYDWEAVARQVGLGLSAAELLKIWHGIGWADGRKAANVEEVERMAALDVEVQRLRGLLNEIVQRAALAGEGPKRE